MPPSVPLKNEIMCQSNYVEIIDNLRVEIIAGFIKCIETSLVLHVLLSLINAI